MPIVASPACQVVSPREAEEDPPVPVFENTQQCYTAECPNGTAGDSVEVCVAAGTFTSTISQEDANAQALASAQSQAEAQLECVELIDYAWDDFEDYPPNSGLDGKNGGGSLSAPPSGTSHHWGGPWDSWSMVSTIVAREAENRVLLQRSAIARPWCSDIGTSWTKLGLFVRWTWQLTTPIDSNEQLFLGLCSGGRRVLGGSTTVDHFVGVRAQGNGATASAHIFDPWVPFKRVWTTDTVGTDFGFSAQVCKGNGLPRNLFAVFITKGSPWSFRLYGRTDSVGPDMSEAEFFDALKENPGLPGYSFSLARTLSVDEETDGFLDHLNVYFDRTSPSMWLSDIAVKRFA